MELVRSNKLITLLSENTGLKRHFIEKNDQRYFVF